MEPLKLSEDAIAWAASIGISRERAEWLAACPKFTPVSRLPHLARKPKAESFHMYCNTKGVWCYRRKIKDISIFLEISTELKVAKYHRDRLDEWLRPHLKMPINDLAAFISAANTDNPDAFPRLAKPRAFSARRTDP